MRGVPRFRVAGGVLVGLVGAVCLVALLVGAAYASSGRTVDWRDLHPVATVNNGIVTDGDRYAVFEMPTGPPAVTVFDTRENRIVRTTALPADCGLAFGGGAGVAGGGYVLVVCGPNLHLSTVRVLQMATGHEVALPDRFPIYAEDAAYFLGVGSQWIEAAECDDPHSSGCAPYYVNWHTRQRRFPGRGERDLSSAELRRQPPATTRVFVRRDTLWLARRGHRLLRLGRCSGVCPYEVSFAAGRVTWTTGLTLHGYLIRRARFYAHRFRRPPSCPFPPDGLLSAHTQYRILTSVDCSTATQQSRGLLYTGAW